jgi:FAD/FMN-containing dehydrogenase
MSVTAASKVPEEQAVNQFKTTLRGKLLLPGDAGYDEERRIFNAMIDRRPGLIVCCAGVADVISAVNFARTHDLLIAVRAAGHNVAGISVCDGGMLIDLSRMKGMRVDPAARTIRVEAGLT